MSVYTPVPVVGFNTAPPEDDGSTVSTNVLRWQTHLDKIGTPLNTAIAGVDTNVAAAFTALTGQTQREADALLTPIDFARPVGQVARYTQVDGSTDNTAAVRALLEHGGFVVHFSRVNATGDTVYIVDDFISVASNTLVVMDPGVIIRIPTGGTIAGTAAASRFGLFRMITTSNIRFDCNFATIEYETKPIDGEFGHIFDIRGASYVTVNDAITRDCGGDGFYVGEGGANSFSEYVELNNVYGDNHRRQGCSIVSGKHIRVKGYFSNITGDVLGCGVDIEPDDNSHACEDIVVDVRTFNCAAEGVRIDLRDIVTGGSVDQNVTIRVKVNDEQSASAGLVTELVTGANVVSGSIIFESVVGIDNVNSTFFVKNYSNNGPHIHVKSPIVSIRPNSAGSGSENIGAAIRIDAEPSDTGTEDTGNVTFHQGFEVNDDRGTPLVTNYFYANDRKSGGADCVNVHLRGRLQGAGQTSAQSMIDFLASGEVEDPDGLTTFATTVGFDMTAAAFTKVTTNEGASGTLAVNLDHDDAVQGTTMPVDGYPSLIFRVEAAQILRIDPGITAGRLIEPGALTDIESNTIGSEIELKLESVGGSDAWRIIRQTGTWT